MEVWDCVEYREWNKKMQPDCMLIPRMQDILDNFGDQKYFTTLDISKTYHQGFMILWIKTLNTLRHLHHLGAYTNG